MTRHPLRRHLILGRVGRRGRTAQLAADQRGTSTIEMAMVIGVFFLVVFGAIQGGVFYHARNAAQSAAAACAERARGEQATPSAGRQSAASVLAQAGALDDYTVAVSASAAAVTCTVTGHAPVVIDLGLGQIRQTATMPKDRAT